jgi:capsid assembly protease
VVEKASEVTESPAPAAGLVMVEGKSWAMHEPKLRALAEHLSGRILLRSDVEGLRAKSGPSTQGNVSVVSLKGVITPEASLMSMLFGGGEGLSGFLRDMRQAVGEADTKAVVIDIDSPGGLVDMVPEAAAELRAMRDDGGKPIVAVANVMAASAAYWLASQAHEIVVTPSGEVGSVGVYSLHRDMSGMAEQMGIKHTFIKAGVHKGNPFESLDEESQQAMQRDVDDYYEMFVTDVASGRGVERPALDGMAFGGGRSYLAKRAVSIGLADRVATLSDTVKRLSSGRSKVKQTTAAYSKEQRLRLLDTLTSR